MTKQDSFKEFVLDQLTGIEPVNCRAMFGAFGLYHPDVFFGILHKDDCISKPTIKPVLLTRNAV